MNKPTIVSILTGTWRPKGGMTSSVLLRSSKFADLGYRTIIFTLDYRADQDTYVSEMVESDSVSARVEILNFFDTFRKNSIANGVRDTSELTHTYKQTQDQSLSRFFAANGDLAYNERTFSDNRIVRRYFNDLRQVVKIEEISPTGIIHRRKLRDPSSGKFTQTTLLNSLGGAYAVTWLNSAEDESGFFLYGAKEENVDVKFYKKTRDAQRAWIKSELSKIEGPVVLLVDNIETLDIVKSIIVSDIQKIAVLHGNHLSDPLNSDSGIKDSYKEFLSEPWDAVVCSTDKQARHVEAALQHKTFVTNIPQAIDDNGPTRESIPLHPRFACFGRIVNLKRLPEIIRSFATVLESYSDSTLDIFGEGQQENEIRDLIVALGIDHAVTLKGVDPNVRSRMTEYTATLFASSQEGFGLVIGESMISATPVISTECNYGPSEIISGDTGLLVGANDFNSFIKGMHWCIENPNENLSMGHAARQRILTHFSRASVTERWVNLLSLMQNSER